MEKSSHGYKFGGREQRQSEGIITIPCLIDDNQEVMIMTEVIISDFPLLLGKLTLKKGLGIKHFGKNNLEILGETLNLRQTKSGH